MKTDKNNNKIPEENPIPGNPIYPAKDDIYNHEEEETFEEDATLNDNEPDEEPQPDPSLLDEGLDVPGADLDDADEIIGEEDEENNYYSLDDQDN
jgi:hypothetical protein